MTQRRGIAEDPKPWLRCVCVHRCQPPQGPIKGAGNRAPDLFYDRCRSEPTQEDGLCDHCRQPVCAPGAGACADCDADRVGGESWVGCCRRADQQGGVVMVDPMEPCGAVLRSFHTSGEQKYSR